MILELENTGFAWQGSKPLLFQGVSMAVEPGEVVCILGPNGVGKTSLLKCLAGLMPLTRGRILCRGKDMAAMGQAQIARFMAYVPQIHYPVFAYSVFETVLMGRTPFLGFFSFPKSQDEQRAMAAIEALHITHLADKAYTELSGGEQQLVMFARALAQEPELIILDEPTAHLDYGNQVKTLSLIRDLARAGTAVVMTSHNPDHAFMVAHRAGIMYDRRINDFGSPGQIVTEKVLKRIYGIEVRLKEDPVFGRICVPALNRGQNSFAGKKTSCQV